MRRHVRPAVRRHGTGGAPAVVSRRHAVDLERDLSTLQPLLGGVEAVTFVEAAATALAHYHDSPVDLGVHVQPMALVCLSWSPRVTSLTCVLQRSLILELGACMVAFVVAGCVLKRKVTRVTKRGTGPDYWIGEEVGDLHELLEVSGTDNKDPHARIREKEANLGKRHLSKPVLLIVTRFCKPDVAVARLPASP